MNRLILKFLGNFLLIILTTGCSKKEWNEYYDRPEWLGPPIYQQLQERKKFTSFLTVIDKAGYQTILSSQGWWTLFAPNDDAFKSFLSDNQLNSIDDISETQAQAIVKYSLILDAFRKDQLTNYQTASGAVPNMAYKRRTAYYDFVKEGPGGEIKKIVDGNSISSNGINTGVYITNDNNNKHIPYFIKGFMDRKELTETDYTAFFPDVSLTDFNVAGARVVTADITAENGIIHEIDKVILPLKSIDEQLASKPEYADFKKLLDDYLVTHTENTELTHRYNVLTGSPDKVYVKLYNNQIAFAPNSENYSNNTTDPQIDGFSMVAPTNSALKEYLYGDNGILEKYGSFTAAPAAVLTDFINAHMWNATLWPSKISTIKNSQNEDATFSASAVLEHKMASNGVFTGVNEVQQANVFRTVYSKPYLDPAYSHMTRVLDETSIKYSLINPTIGYTLFNISNDQFGAEGYGYDTRFLIWTYSVNGVAQSTALAKDNIYRIVQTSVIPGKVNDLSGEGVLQTFNEEYIKYKNGKVYAAGNEDVGDVVTIDNVENTANGPVYYTRGILKFTVKELGFHLAKLASSQPSRFSHFYNYLLNSVVYTSATQVITGTSTGSFYTILVPTNAAIEQAVRDGILPGNTATGEPNFNPSDANQVANFIKYHILNKKTVAADGKTDEPMTLETLLTNLEGGKEYIQITKQASGLRLQDTKGNTVTLDVPHSNNLANRTLIHSINNVLRYGDL